MIVERNCATGDVIGVKFESGDTLGEIASMCRCTADELAYLMWNIYADEWQGQEVYWEEE